MEWWQGSLFYEIFPASFQDSSKGGDGIGDLRGITMRLDYLMDLGVKAVRLNSIFSSKNYPESYSSVTSLTDIDENLGTQEDFDALLTNLHRRNMSLILDLPLYPFVKNNAGGMLRRLRTEESETGFRVDRDSPNSPKNPSTAELPEALPTIASALTVPRSASIHDIASARNSSSHIRQEAYLSSNHVNPEVDEHVVTRAIKFWAKKGVDGFYLKGLRHYVNDANFVQLLNDWRIVSESYRVLICDWETLDATPEGMAKDTLLEILDLVDVKLRLSNGTRDVKAQIDAVTNGILFAEPYSGHPWVHWSIGGVNTRRVSSMLEVKNASAAVTLLGMMLPGTPSIFYGDEVSRRKRLDSIIKK